MRARTLFLASAAAFALVATVALVGGMLGAPTHAHAPGTPAHEDGGFAVSWHDAFLPALLAVVFFVAAFRVRDTPPAQRR